MRQRKLLLPPFHGERMREYEERDRRGDARATWRAGRWAARCACTQRTRAITLEVILRAVFGVEAERMGPLKAAIGGLMEPTPAPDDAALRAAPPERASARRGAIGAGARPPGRA